MKKLLFIFAALLLNLAPCEISVAAPAAKASTPKGFSIDADAVALFDRAAKLYSECKTIRMRWISTDESTLPDEEKPTITTIAFVRPLQSKVEIKNGYLPRELYLVDGKFSWNLQSVNSTLTTYSKKPLSKDDTALGNALFNLELATDTPGLIFSSWLRGEHELQSAWITHWKWSSVNVEYFEAKKLASATWKKRSWERVQIRQRSGADEEINKAVSLDHIYWLAPDNARLVRIQELDKNGKIYIEQEIVEQTFDASIPASTFVFKIPRGAKKE